MFQILSEQGLSGILRVVRCKASASSLAPSLIPTLVLHLPKLCEYLVRGKQYTCNKMSFRMQTVAEKLARITLDHASLTLRLHELVYLVLNLTSLANQMGRYKLAEADVLAYVQSAAGAATFIPPKEAVCLCAI
jgi:hypothetical protein